MSEAEAETVRVTLRLTKREYDVVSERAQRSGVSTATEIRRALALAERASSPDVTLLEKTETSRGKTSYTELM